MKFSNVSFFAAAAAAASQVNHAAAGDCPSIEAAAASDSIGVKATLVGDIAAKNTAPGSYNLMVAEKVLGGTAFIDSKEGIIYIYDSDKDKLRKIYDISEDSLPDGVNVAGFNRPRFPFNAGNDKKIHQVTNGPNEDELIVVFQSTTLPAGATALPLPSGTENFEYQLWNDGDCSDAAIEATCGTRDFGPPPLVNPFAGPYCCTSQLNYELFYKFKVRANSIIEPELFFAYETQRTYGHDGGAMLTVPDGRFLWATGDCLPFGWNGLDAPQDPSSHCGKMLLIDPSDGSYEIAALGVRNSQLMFLEGANVHFQDIGGVTAEEVNTIPLAELLDTTTETNFGWGERPGCEKFGREGTFVVETGSRFGAFGASPPCIDEQRDSEKTGFVLPHMQFGNSPDAGGAFFAISSAVVSPVSFDTIKVAATEFNDGVFIAGFEEYDAETAPTAAFQVKMYKDDGAGGITELENSLNDLVGDFLNEDPARGDPRFFRFPDGSAGVLIERTGAFYKLEEIQTGA